MARPRKVFGLGCSLAGEPRCCDDAFRADGSGGVRVQRLDEYQMEDVGVDDAWLFAASCLRDVVAKVAGVEIAEGLDGNWDLGRDAQEVQGLAA